MPGLWGINGPTALDRANQCPGLLYASIRPDVARPAEAPPRHQSPPSPHGRQLDPWPEEAPMLTVSIPFDLAWFLGGIVTGIAITLLAIGIERLGRMTGWRL